MVHRAVGVTGAGQAAAGAVGEVSLLAILALQAGVARHTRALAGLLIALVWVQNPLAAAAAVAKALWVEELGVGWGECGLR